MLLPEAQRRRVVDAMRDVGAISPASARKASQLPELVRENLEYYVTLGVVREGPPGTFYLFVAPPPPAWSARRTILAVLFWLLVIIVPVFILWLSNQRT
jgi:hypothetical protein